MYYAHKVNRIHWPTARAFSLVEVVLALGIAVFALIAIVGLLPVGLKLAQESDEESRAINILSQVAADRRITSSVEPSHTYKLPKLVGTSELSGSFGVAEDGSYEASDFAHARYRVTYILLPPTANSENPWHFWMRVSWPAQNANANGGVETVVTIPLS